MKKILLSSLIIASQLFPIASHATTQKDIDVLANAINFIKDAPTGNVDVAIVFDPSIPDSVTHADEAFAFLSSKVKSGKIMLSGTKVDISKLNANNSKVIFITKGMEKHSKTILAHAKSKKVVTVSNDMNCLKTACLITAKSVPSVDIYLNTKIEETTGITFASAFRMMIKKQ